MLIRGYLKKLNNPHENARSITRCPVRLAAAATAACCCPQLTAPPPDSLIKCDPHLLSRRKVAVMPR